MMFASASSSATGLPAGSVTAGNSPSAIPPDAMLVLREYSRSCLSMTAEVRAKRDPGRLILRPQTVELAQVLEHLFAELTVLHHAVVHGEPGLRIERIRELVRLVLRRAVVDADQPLERNPVAVARLVHAVHGHLHDGQPPVEFREPHELGQPFVEPRRVLAGELRRQVEVRVLVKDELHRRAAHGVAVHHHDVAEGPGWNQPATFCRGSQVLLPLRGADDHDAGRHRVLQRALAERLFERDAKLREVLDELARLVGAARGVDGEIFHLVAHELAEARFGSGGCRSAERRGRDQQASYA